MLTKIVSGGQTGVDRGALDAALVEWATEIKVRAERRAGELLAGMAERGERPLGRPEKESQTATLSELGVSRSQSSRWQKLAAVPEAQFEQAVAAAKEIAGEVTTAAMLRLNHNHRAQGTGETLRFCESVGKPAFTVDGARTSVEAAAATAIEFVERHRISVLNVAGPRESTYSGAGEYGKRVVSGILAASTARSATPPGR